MEQPVYIEKRGTSYYLVLDEVAKLLDAEQPTLGLCFIDFVNAFSALLTSMNYFKEGITIIPLRLVRKNGSGADTTTELRLYRHFSVNSITVDVSPVKDTVSGLIRRFNRTSFPNSIEVSERIFDAILSQYRGVVGSDTTATLTTEKVVTYWAIYEDILETAHSFVIQDFGRITQMQIAATKTQSA